MIQPSSWATQNIPPTLHQQTITTRKNITAHTQKCLKQQTTQFSITTTRGTLAHHIYPSIPHSSQNHPTTTHRPCFFFSQQPPPSHPLPGFRRHWFEITNPRRRHHQALPFPSPVPFAQIQLIPISKHRKPMTRPCICHMMHPFCLQQMLPSRQIQSFLLTINQMRLIHYNASRK